MRGISTARRDSFLSADYGRVSAAQTDGSRVRRLRCSANTLYFGHCWIKSACYEFLRLKEMLRTTACVVSEYPTTTVTILGELFTHNVLNNRYKITGTLVLFHICTMAHLSHCVTHLWNKIRLLHHSLQFTEHYCILRVVSSSSLLNYGPITTAASICMFRL
jgi:hypothetical protein